METRCPRLWSAIANSVVIPFIICALLLPIHAAFTLDGTFGGGSGKLWISFADPPNTNYTSQAIRVFVQSNNRILVAGSFTKGTPDGQLTGVAVVGLTPSGGIDTGFAGGAGAATDWRPDAFTDLSDFLMSPNGSTLRMSQIFRLPVGSSTVQATRLTADGGIDTVFGTNATIGPCCFGFFSARPVQIAARSDGKVLALITDQGAYQLYRLNSDGTRDTTFGTNGVQGITFNKFSITNFVEMIPLSDGKVLLVGNIDSNEFFFARLTETGNWDKTFGRSGFLRVPFGAGNSGSVRKALLQADGNILVAGTVTSGDTDVWMARFRPNGRRDSTFGTDGVVVSDRSPAATDFARSMAVSADGKIRIAGEIGSSPNQSFLIARFSANGTFEEQITLPFTTGLPSGANDITVQPDGKVLVVGYSKNETTGITGNVMAIMRLTE
ncbi:MAG TPA: hypothetical protein VJV05_06375 [Pyrinomonadaceae bacterium]|nr:hypothetical protein [Pyrinomonadaceae bacterium]